LVPDDDEVVDNVAPAATVAGVKDVYDYIYNDPSVSAYSGIWRDRVDKGTSTTNAST
jgi:hypothetical protein